MDTSAEQSRVDATHWLIPTDVQHALRTREITHLFPVQQTLMTLLSNTVSESDLRSNTKVQAVQRRRLPARDICISASTGSGKTLAYLLPIVKNLILQDNPKNTANGNSSKSHKLRAIIVVPTRDLAQQVHSTLQTIIKGTHITSAVVGGVNSLEVEKRTLVVNNSDLLVRDLLTYTQDDAERGSENRIHAGLNKLQGAMDSKDANIIGEDTNDEESDATRRYFTRYESLVDILICTPGRLVDHMKYTKGFTLIDLQYLVLDEADRLLSQNFHDWLKVLLEVSGNRGVPMSDASGNDTKATDGIIDSILYTPSKRPIQKLLFSATLSNDPRLISMLKLNSPLYVQISSVIRKSKNENGDKVLDTNTAVTSSTDAQVYVGNMHDVIRGDNSKDKLTNLKTNSQKIINIEKSTTINGDGEEDENDEDENGNEGEMDSNPRPLTAKYVLPATLEEYVSVMSMEEDQPSNKKRKRHDEKIDDSIANVTIDKPLQLIMLLLQYQTKGILIFTRSVEAAHRLSAIVQVFKTKWLETYSEYLTMTNSSMDADDHEVDDGTFNETILDDNGKPMSLHQKWDLFSRGWGEFDVASTELNARVKSPLCIDVIKSITKYLKQLTIRSFSAELKQTERNKLLDNFKKEKITVLISTDVVCRGVDLEESVKVVINYDIPPKLETYVHRVGRTARAGYLGIALSILEPREMKWFKKEIIRTKDILHSSIVQRAIDIRSNPDGVTLPTNGDSSSTSLTQQYAELYDTKSNNLSNLQKIKLPKNKSIQDFFGSMYESAVADVGDLVKNN